ncbi:MAG: lipocalin family protein [Algibacter sp.]
MKTLSYKHLLIMLIALIAININHAQNTQEQLIGTWTFDYDTSLDMMAQKSKTHYNKMDATRQDKISASYKGRIITFNNNGTYTHVLANGKTTSATWILNNNNNLEITPSSGITASFIIKKLEIDTLTLSPINNKGVSTSILFSNWHLTKN